MSSVTPFPGSVSARNALTSNTATEEQRAAAIGLSGGLGFYAGLVTAIMQMGKV